MSTSTTRRIGLLLMGHVDPKSQHIGGDYPELFAALLDESLTAHGIELVRYDLDEERFPLSVNECDGWLCSPSRLSAYDPVPWLADAEELLRAFVATEKPFVGICFGHQLLAQALGGFVERSPLGWGVGLQDYEIVSRRPWMDGVNGAEKFALMGSHQDQVIRLPADAELLFRSDFCPFGGFAIGERAWTIQTHPEFTPDLADHLLAGRYELIGAERVDAARSTLSGPASRTPDRALVASWIVNFFQLSPS